MPSLITPQVCLLPALTEANSPSPADDSGVASSGFSVASGSAVDPAEARVRSGSEVPPLLLDRAPSVSAVGSGSAVALSLDRVSPRLGGGLLPRAAATRRIPAAGRQSQQQGQQDYGNHTEERKVNSMHNAPATSFRYSAPNMTQAPPESNP